MGVADAVKSLFGGSPKGADKPITDPTFNVLYEGIGP